MRGAGGGGGGGGGGGSKGDGRGESKLPEAETALNQAWDLYYTAFRRINKQLPSLTTLELSACSPALLNADNLELGIPGTYRVDGSYVRIQRFFPSIQVITSKQRPRKITLRGDDGRDYMYLLKGHEDLRQDERVMQLFGLVNALLAKDRRTNSHDLSIQRYAVTPLSHNAGVVGWVPSSDTLHSLIRDFRETRKVMLNMEHRLMMKMAPDYDLLTQLQKVEVFEAALNKTSGKDLYQVLWLKSKDSEEWLERRTNYSRSLAVMSMVGYILGLGDRHPSNLMLDRESGKLLHIDFGDCFEVAMNRAKFPEKIPFRLTRMLINALEVSGIEGSFRLTCEKTMSVLRENRDSLVAMLEAFVYDPLISWRLLNSNKGKEAAKDGKAGEKEAGANGEGKGGGGTEVIKEAIIEEGDEDEEEDKLSEGKEGGGGEDDVNTELPNILQLRKLSRGRGDSIPEDTEAEAIKKTNSYSSSLNVDRYAEIQKCSASMNGRIASLATSDMEATAITSKMSGGSAAVGSGLSWMSVAGIDKEPSENLNEKALKVIRRVQDKLEGTDFEDVRGGDGSEELSVQDQVERLILQATNVENLCLCFIGWCAFW